MSTEARHDHADPDEKMPYDRAEWEARLDAARARRAEALARGAADRRPPARQDLGARLARARAEAAARAAAPAQPPLRLGPEVRLPEAPVRDRPRWRRRLAWGAVALACLTGGTALLLSQDTPLRAWVDALTTHLSAEEGPTGEAALRSPAAAELSFLLPRRPSGGA